MVREIKFRAWDKVNKRWYADVQDAYEGDCIGGPWNCFGGYLDDENMEVVQFTGLKDKNGVEIHDKDCLQHYHQYRTWRQIVEWGPQDGSEVDSIGWNLDPECVGDCEVIGNVLENPELQERKK